MRTIYIIDCHSEDLDRDPYFSREELGRSRFCPYGYDINRELDRARELIDRIERLLEESKIRGNM